MRLASHPALALAAGTLAALVAVALGHDGLPINPALGVPGFPDCIHPGSPSGDVDGNAHALVCHQRPKDHASQLSVGCIGDSITAGVHSSGGNHTYPGQLQILLGDGYKVTNLGACGSTMLKKGNSPYWQRPQFKTLTSNKWDVIVIMLGTNDAKDTGSGGPANWPHDCTGPEGAECPFGQDYKSMIDLVRTLGTTPAGPEIFIAIPPPLMKQGVYGMNATVINKVFPDLVPAINSANSLPHNAIDVFDALGGNMQSQFPPGGCTLSTMKDAGCANFCDQQSCDQCHPDDVGYHLMAQTIQAGIGRR